LDRSCGVLTRASATTDDTERAFIVRDRSRSIACLLDERRVLDARRHFDDGGHGFSRLQDTLELTTRVQRTSGRDERTREADLNHRIVGPERSRAGQRRECGRVVAAFELPQSFE
jgi:hypothetical protein